MKRAKLHRLQPWSSCCSVTQSRPTLWDPMDCSTPGLPVLYHLPELSQTHARWVGDVIQPSHPLLPLLLLPSIFTSIRVFSNESALHIRWPKNWSFMFRISPSNEYSWLISFRINWFESCPRGSQESSTPQFKSINFLVLSFLYGPTLTSIHTTGKNHSFNYMDLCWQSNFSTF